MRKDDKQELRRIVDKLAKTEPGTPEYNALLEQRLKFGDALLKECDATQLIPGIKNETLGNGLLAGVEFGFMTWGLEKFFVNKNLIAFLPKFHLKL